MRIKLPKDIVKCVEKEHDLQYEIQQLSTASRQINTDLWKALKEKYKDFNFTGATVENETGMLILPFEKDKKEG